MFGKMSRVLVVVVALFMLVGTVSAQINLPANGYLGGDSLFCSSARGCWLLNSNRPANGSVPVLLGEFPQADIQGALATCAAEAHNVIIGTIQGTYGPFTLSAVYDGPNADPVCSLQINAFEAVSKEAKPYVFKPTASGGYAPISAPFGSGRCQYDLAAIGEMSWDYDANHVNYGFDVMDYSKPDGWIDDESVFLEWLPDNPGLPTCPDSGL